MTVYLGPLVGPDGVDFVVAISLRMGISEIGLLFYLITYFETQNTEL